METKSFSTLYVNNLTVTDDYSLNKTTIECVNAVKDSTNDIIKAALLQLEIDNAAMGAQMNKSKKSILTAQITEKDTERNERFAEIKRTVTTAFRGRDADKKAAAEILKVFLTPYWDTDKKAMNTKTGIFFEMFQKYNASELLIEYAVTVGINIMMSELEPVNSEFDTLYQTRNTEEASQSGPSASSLKSAAVKSYERLCIAIEQAVNLTPSDTLTKLFNQMDEMRKKYALILSKKEKEEETAKTVTT